MLGILGVYQCPPTALGLADQGIYYVVTKGLYVGIFNDWFVSTLLPLIASLILLMMSRDEVGAWVLGVSGSLYRKAGSWEKAKTLYNACLASSAVQVLA